jgi:hypothetical protein
MDEESYRIGDRVQVHLNSKTWGVEGWFAGCVVRIDPYSEHRSFYWVELDEAPSTQPGPRKPLISVLNPRNIRKT